MAYIHIQKGELDDRKFDSFVRKCIFVGNNSSIRMWRVFYSFLRCIIYSRDVVLFENESYYKAEVDADKVFDTKRNSVLALEYENKADLIKEQFYHILWQQTRDDTKDRVLVNDAKE